MDKERYDTVLEYGKLYKSFKITDMNIESESIVSATRSHLIEMCGKDLVVAIEEIINYEQYGGSEQLMEFIKNTKSFVLTVIKYPNKLKALVNKWIDLNPMELYAEDNSNSLENLIVAVLTKSVHDFLDNLKE